MSLLTNIVKSSSVVDNRPQRAGGPIGVEAVMSSQSVLKRQLLVTGLMREASPPTAPLTHKQSHLDELNRLKVDIAEAQAELKSLRREFAEKKAEMEKLAEPVAAPISQPSGAPLGDLAVSLIDGAQAQAAEIVGKAKVESAAITEQARNDGYLEGFSKGYEEARSEFLAANEPKAEQLSRILDAISNLEQRMLRKSERQLVDLVIAVAQKIIGRAIKTDKTVIADMLRDVMEQNHHEQFVRITLSADLAPVEAHAQQEVVELLESMGADVTVLVDDKLPEGGLVVETPGGFVDLSVGVQLENLHASILTE